MRRAYEDIFRRLSEMGMGGAQRLFDQTPREIEWEIRALAARRAERAEELAALAWLVGKYVSLGVHAPQRYPARPPEMRAPRGEMSAEQMKRTLLHAVGRRDRDDASGA